MKRVVLFFGLIIGGMLVWPWVRVNALALATLPTADADFGPPHFNSPYNTPQPLEQFLVFTAPPQFNIPDGQIHWVDSEVPGIDTLGPDLNVYSMCPGDGRAWTLKGGDPFGGGTFIAIECEGRAANWQMLAFHLCAVGIEYSISASHRVYTRVSSGQIVGRECADDHIHLSLGYWADENAQLALPCPQWYVQERYWVNAACLLKANGLPQIAPFHLTLEDDWELRYLTPALLGPLRRFALLGLSLGLSLYLALAVLRLFRAPAADETAPVVTRLPVAAIKTGIWVSGLLILALVSAGPIWPVNAISLSGYTTDPARYQAMAQIVGYGDWELLRAFYLVAVPRDANGEPVSEGESGKVFPPEAAAAIPFGETNTDAWTTVDPTQPGPYGQYKAWEAVAERWPPSLYQQTVLGLTLSPEAQRQRAGLQALAASADMQALGRALGKTIRAEDLYGSSAGAVGRTQILPGHFASGGICGTLPIMDVWNSRLAVAECTTRYLSVSGCWGSWWANGDVWSALCGYNPGAWNRAVDQWYWNVLQDRMTRLAATATQIGLQDALAPTSALSTSAVGPESNISTPVLGLITTEALLQNGHSRYQLPGLLDTWVRWAGPRLTDYHAEVRVLYRFFRAWTMIYYAPEDLLRFGVQF